MAEENKVARGVISWDDDRSTAMTEYGKAIESYTGISHAYGNSRTYIDIESNRSVRPYFSRNDYYSFRPNEQIPTKHKSIIKMCMDAYDKVGIIRNVIDLMGDFGSQGISLVHEQPGVEKFYQQWFKKVNGKERSERFLNLLYRTGNVICYKSYAQITPEIKKYVRSLGEDSLIKVEVPNFDDQVLPWRYTFLNPMKVDLKNSKISLFLDKKSYELDTTQFFDNFKTDTLPQDIVDMFAKQKRGGFGDNKKIDLDPERIELYFYKKDDWSAWANPMTYAILDDVIMLEKMRLADAAALDGAISNIRLWTLGDFENKILPTREGINKLRDILASNTGGGTMDLVWGPELKFTESNSQIYKFLGSEKYQSVLNSIYAGLGVPPTLTGMANNGGGFTNNFISLKTLVERLQYGRSQLTKFWEFEIENVRRAMGFQKPAHIAFDQMSLNDEATEKNLLIQLADRDIISHQTVLERFKENPSVEKVRLNREETQRDKGKMLDKVGPFHPDQQLPENSPNSKNPNGRPKFKQDSNPRKTRVAKPRSNPGVANFLSIATQKYDEISEIVTAGYLKMKEKKNIRVLTKNEVAELEDIKISILSCFELEEPLLKKDVLEACANKRPKNTDLVSYIKEHNIDPTKQNINEYRSKIIGAYLDYHLS